MHIAPACGPLHLDPLPHQIQRKRPRLGHDTRHRARHRTARTKRQFQPAQMRPQRLVRRKEEAHIRNNLRQPGAQPAEKPPRAFLAPDLRHGAPQAGVDAVVALRGEPRAQQVQRVGSRGGRAAADGARDEGLGRLWECALAEGLLQEQRGRAVGGELDRAVADVEELRGHVALPEAGYALGAEDVPEGGERAFVDGPALEVAVGEGVGEGMGLELKADFDDVEGGDDEAGKGWMLAGALDRDGYGLIF